MTRQERDLFFSGLQDVAGSTLGYIRDSKKEEDTAKAEEMFDDARRMFLFTNEGERREASILALVAVEIMGLVPDDDFGHVRQALRQWLM
jgi:hypothetical protein